MCERTQAQIAYEQKAKEQTLKKLARRKPKQQVFVITKSIGIIQPIPRDLITYK